MTGYPKNYPSDSGIQIGIIASGGDPNGNGDFPSDQSSNMKVVSPLEHGTGVNPEHISFSTLMAAPDAWSQCTFKGALTPGTPVLFMKTSGQSGGVIIGQLNGINNSRSSRVPGNSDLLSNWEKFTTMDTGVSMPPKIQETTERGAKVRKIQETGETFSLDKLEGLPIHGALFDMTGFKLPEVKKVPTAKQENTKMMNQNILDQLPGALMSLGQMFQGLMSKGKSNAGNPGSGYGQSATPASSNNSVSFNEPTYMDEIYDNLPNQQLKDTIRSLSSLVQSLEVSGGVSFVTDGVVHEGVYLENARDLLSQAQNIDDVMYVLSRLQWDTTLFGREKLDVIETEIETAWGVALQQVDVDGEIVVRYANTSNAMAQMNAFTSLITSNTTAPSIGSTPPPSSSGGGGGGGAGNIAGKLQGMLGNMFGKSAGTMQEMMKRLHPEGEKTAKKLQEKVNQGKKQQKMKQISEATIKNKGKPDEKSNYDVTYGPE